MQSALTIRFDGKVALDTLLAPLWAAAFALLFTHAASWAYARQLDPVTPGLVIEAFATAGVVVMLFSLLRGVVRPQVYPWTFLIAIAAYGALCVNPLTAASLDEGSLVIDRLGFVAGCVSFIGLAAATRRIEVVLAMLRWTVVAICLINLVDQYGADFVPVDLTDFPGRAAGFYQNPNIAAMTIAAALPLAVWGRPGRSRSALYAVTLVGILPTDSRGGLVLWALALLLSEATQAANPRRYSRFILLAALAAVPLVIVAMLRDTIIAGIATHLPGQLDPAAMDRYVKLDDFSAEERRYGARIAWQAFLNAPLLGNGVGYFVQQGIVQGPHNMVLLTLSELGALGAAWFGVFTVSLFRFGSRIGLAAALIFLAACMFSHNLFDDAVWAILFGLYWRVAVGLRPARDRAPQANTVAQQWSSPAVSASSWKGGSA